MFQPRQSISSARVPSARKGRRRSACPRRRRRWRGRRRWRRWRWRRRQKRRPRSLRDNGLEQDAGALDRLSVLVLFAEHGTRSGSHGRGDAGQRGRTGNRKRVVARSRRVRVHGDGMRAGVQAALPPVVAGASVVAAAAESHLAVEVDRHARQGHIDLRVEVQLEAVCLLGRNSRLAHVHQRCRLRDGPRAAARVRSLRAHRQRVVTRTGRIGVDNDLVLPLVESAAPRVVSRAAPVRAAIARHLAVEVDRHSRQLYRHLHARRELEEVGARLRDVHALLLRRALGSRGRRRGVGGGGAGAGAGVGDGQAPNRPDRSDFGHRAGDSGRFRGAPGLRWRSGRVVPVPEEPSSASFTLGSAIFRLTIAFVKIKAASLGPAVGGAVPRG